MSEKKKTNIILYTVLGIIGAIVGALILVKDFKSYWDTVGWVYLATGLYSSYDNYWEIYEKLGLKNNDGFNFQLCSYYLHVFHVSTLFSIIYSKDLLLYNDEYY